MVLSVGLIPGALRALPGASKAERTGFMEAIQRFDVPGGLSLALGAGFALLGVTEGQVNGFRSPISWGSFVLSALLAVFFVWRTRTASVPFVSPELFRNRAFLSTAAVGFFMMFANIGSLVLFAAPPLRRKRASGGGHRARSGARGHRRRCALAARGQALRPVRPAGARQDGPRHHAGSTFSISAFAAGAPALWVGAGLFGLGLGFAAVNSPNANAATATLSPEESGVGLGIYQMIFFLGGGFGPAVAATFLAFRNEAGRRRHKPALHPDAAPYSDAFLLVSAATIVAFVASFGLKSTTRKETP